MNRKNEYFANKFTKLLEQWKKDNKKVRLTLQNLLIFTQTILAGIKKEMYFLLIQY